MMSPDPTRRAVLAGLAVATAGPSLAQTGPNLAQTAAAASRALNTLTAASGRFTQTNPGGGLAPGRFWINRPGRVRFEYDPPSPLLVVSDGSTVIVRDRALNTTDRAALRATPLFFLLKADIDLARDTRPVRAAREGELLLLSVQDRAGQAEGELTVAFDAASMALRGWSILDGQGRTTRVRLDSLQAGAVPAGLFNLRDAIMGRTSPP